MAKKRVQSLLFLLLCFFISYSQQVLPYKNKALPVSERVKDLLSRMTAEEKFWQLFMIPGDLDPAHPDKYINGCFGFQVSAGSGTDAGGQILTYNTSASALQLAKKINAIQKYFVEKSRLGIPIIAFDEALHGLLRGGATAFPQSIALAASFDTTLMREVAATIATEVKMRGIRDILSPVINIASDVRWGRTEETYGEDPFLSAAMGVAFIKAFESRGIITTPKHFLANVGDGGRDSYPIHANERLLREIYLPPFESVFKDGGARSVMTAYNSIDGTASSANKWLLETLLKKEWGFDGFVISDANAVGGSVVLHKTAADYPESGRQAITGGLDVIFQTDYEHHKLFQPPFLDGRIDSNRINDAVARVLKAKFDLGLFENPYIDENEINIPRTDPKIIAKKAALESIVLLKNQNGLLPISKKTKTIALIGEEITKARLGGYSGPGNQPISILKGIEEKVAGKTKIIYAKGAGINKKEYDIISSAYLSSDGGKNGLAASYYSNIDFSGEPVVKRIDEQINFHWTLFPPDSKLTSDFYSAQWKGFLKSPVTGKFKIGLEGNQGFRLYINEKIVIDAWNKQTYATHLTDFLFEKGKSYSIRIDFYEPNGNNATVKLIWNATVKDDYQQRLQEALAAARQSDVVVIAAGIHEGEFQDRAYLSLPGDQEAIIQAVAATGKPVVLLLVGGSAITMDKWINKVGAIADIWYPGEEGGRAVADVLFGDYNPAGRLPITFPVHEAQLPLVYNHKPTGRGDDYHNLSGLPLFPFGYGLSYTSFAYSDISLSSSSIGAGEKVAVSCTIKNTGKYAGDEVVQLYLRDELATVSRPVMELKGFQRVSLQPGEEKRVTFIITDKQLMFLDADMKKILEPGDVRVMIGASSMDLRVKATLKVK